MTKNKTNQIIIPPDIKPYPAAREVSAAIILAKYFQKKVYFIKRSNYKTPDFMIGGKAWELKTPIGKGKYNIQHLLHSAIQQSSNIVVDARFSKMHITKIKRELKFHSQLTTKGIKKLLLITKTGHIIVII